MINFNAYGKKIGETKTIAFSKGKDESKVGRISVFNNPSAN